MGGMLNAGSRGVKVIALGCRFRSWEGAESPILSHLPVVHGSFRPGEGLWLLSLEETVSCPGDSGAERSGVEGGAKGPCWVGTTGAMVLGI